MLDIVFAHWICEVWSVAIEVLITNNFWWVTVFKIIKYTRVQFADIKLLPHQLKNVFPFVSSIIDHTLNDVILYLLLHLPECIAYYLSNDVIKGMSLLTINPFILVASRSNFPSFQVNGGGGGARNVFARNVEGGF